jgi:hypothetical protein
VQYNRDYFVSCRGMHVDLLVLVRVGHYLNFAHKSSMIRPLLTS